MKKCPLCAEQIQDEAIKCRYCGSAFGSTLPKTIVFRFRHSMKPALTLYLIGALAGPGVLVLWVFCALNQLFSSLYGYFFGSLCSSLTLFVFAGLLHLRSRTRVWTLSDLSLTIEGPFRGVQCLTLVDVQSVTVRGEGFPNSLLNIGTIVVQAAGSVEQLTDVDRPYRVCAAILERVKAIRDRERSGERT